MRLAIVLGLLAACTHHPDASTLATRHGEDVKVTSSMGEQDAVVEVQPQGEVLFRTADGRALSWGEVSQVTETIRWRGGLEGLGIGLAIGAGGGIVLGLADGDDTCDTSRGTDNCYYTMTAGDKAFVGAIVFGVLGAGIGGIIGLLDGSDDVYAPPAQQPQPRFVPTGPPGSVMGATLRF